MISINNKYDKVIKTRYYKEMTCSKCGLSHSVRWSESGIDNTNLWICHKCGCKNWETSYHRSEWVESCEWMTNFTGWQQIPITEEDWNKARPQV